MLIRLVISLLVSILVVPQSCAVPARAPDNQPRIVVTDATERALPGARAAFERAARAWCTIGARCVRVASSGSGWRVVVRARDPDRHALAEVDRAVRLVVIYTHNAKGQKYRLYWQGESCAPGLGVSGESLVAHEMGHVVGLSHSEREGSVMLSGVNCRVREPDLRDLQR